MQFWAAGYLQRRYTKGKLMLKIIKNIKKIRNFLLGIIICIIYLPLSQSYRSRFTNFLINLALPEPTVSNKRFSTFSKWLLAISFLILITISLPFLISYLHPIVISDNRFQYIIDNHDVVKQWSSYLEFTAEISLIFFLGGAIFSEALSTKFKDQIENYQSRRNSILQNMQGNIPISIRSSYANVSTLFSELNIKNFYKEPGKKLVAISKLADTTLYGIPGHLKKFMYIKFYSSFPGGLYGLITYVLFIILSLLKIFIMYLGLPIFKK